MMRGPDWREAYGGEFDTTNNRMELTGAMEGLLLVPIGRPLTIYTDSMYVVRGITESIHQWRRQNWRTSTNQPVKNADLWEALEEAANMRVVTWCWVKGHSGVLGNERADFLATQGVPPAPPG